MNHLNKLPELIKPQFFAGQYLHDEDLQSIVEWAEYRFRIHGENGDWGVVCGLELSHDDTSPNHRDRTQNHSNSCAVIVAPGIAFNAKHELCMLDKPLHVELPQAECSPCGQIGEKIAFGPVSDMDRNKLTVFDLFLLPSDRENRNVVGASANGKRNCGVSRLKVAAVVKTEQVHLEDKPTSSHADKPEVTFLEELWKLLGQPDSANESNAVERSRPSIMTWLESKSKYCPGLIRVWPTVLSKLSANFSHAELVDVLSWMCFSLRLTKPACCSKNEKQDIPLARVWVQTNGYQRSVVWIDDRSPYRKSQGQVRASLIPREWLGSTLELVQPIAQLQHVSLSASQWEPKSIQDLKTIFSREPDLDAAIEPGVGLIAICRLVYQGVPSIVAFKKISETPNSIPLEEEQPTPEIGGATPLTPTPIDLTPVPEETHANEPQNPSEVNAASPVAPVSNGPPSVPQAPTEEGNAPVANNPPSQDQPGDASQDQPGDGLMPGMAPEQPPEGSNP